MQLPKDPLKQLKAGQPLDFKSNLKCSYKYRYYIGFLWFMEGFSSPLSCRLLTLIRFLDVEKCE